LILLGDFFSFFGWDFEDEDFVVFKDEIPFFLDTFLIVEGRITSESSSSESVFTGLTLKISIYI